MKHTYDGAASGDDHLLRLCEMLEVHEDLPRVHVVGDREETWVFLVLPVPLAERR